jgi:hypothetical protein
MTVPYFSYIINASFLINYLALRNVILPYKLSNFSSETVIDLDVPCSGVIVRYNRLAILSRLLLSLSERFQLFGPHYFPSHCDVI